MLQLPRTPSLRLDGKRALVTGGSSGIGLGSVVALAEAGAHVVIAARDEQRLQQVCEAMTEAGFSAELMVLDVGDTEAIQVQLQQQAAFDVVVNSAGYASPAPALETSATEYQRVMDVNVRGAFFLSTITAQAMIDAGISGSIIHVSSQMGHVGGIDRSVYCASKHAVEGMVKALAIEWGPHNIRVNTICPTFIKTPLTEATFNNPERVEWIQSKIKLDRIGEVEDIMGSVLYLASSASALVTGSSLLVDGGWTAG